MQPQDGGFAAAWKRALVPGLRRGLDLLLPPAALDGGARPLSPGLSAPAWTSISFLEDPVCDGCGSPFDYDVQGLCPACLARPRQFDRCRAACLYDENSRDLILQLKHGDRTDLAGLFARWLLRAAAPLIEDADAVAPAPLHPIRLLARRYNQAAEIARPFARLAGRRYLPDALVRVRRTGTQGGKSGRGRRLNVKGAFVVPQGRARQVEGKRILLVDDVLTTGATAEACAVALKKAGASAVHVAVIARVREAVLAPI
jgi:ComF family protein